MIKLNSKDIISISKMATKEPYRVNLACVRFWQGKMFATDGHALTLHEVEGLKDELNNYVIPLDVVKVLPKNEILNVDLENRTIEASMCKYTLQVSSELNLCQLISRDVNYADFKDIKGYTPQGFTFGCNPELLYKAVKSSPLYKKDIAVKHVIADGLSPIKSYIDGVLVAVTMPQKV